MIVRLLLEEALLRGHHRQGSQGDPGQQAEFGKPARLAEEIEKSARDVELP